MSEDQFGRLMKDAAATYNRPPAKAPLDEMWSSIEAEAFGTTLPVRRRVSLVGNPWLRMAAVLVLGMVIGRVSIGLQKPAATPVAETTATAAVHDPSDSYQLTT